MGFSSEKERDQYILTRSDIRHVSPRYIGPKQREISLPGGEYVDIWGVARKPVSYGPDSYPEICAYPLQGVKTVKELDDYTWPSADWFDYSGIKNQIRAWNRDDEYAIMLGGGNLFESAWYMRGFERIFMDMIDAPELVEAFMTRVTDFYIKRAERALEAADGEADLFFTADDIGQQEGLLVSLKMWARQIKPHHVRLNKALKRYGVKIVYHSDGAVSEAIDGLIDMGIDTLEAVQLDAKGMDPVWLKRKAGNRLSFHGGISVQSLLPFETPERVEAEVRRLVDIFAEGGGYIPAPSHAIQAGTPPDNIAAMLRAVGRA